MPDTPHGHLAETYPAVPESISRARTAVSALAAQAGAGADALDAVRLATSEAVTNAVLYAYGDDVGPIHISATVTDRGLSVTVADEGDGVRPRLDRKGIGIGLAVIAEAADELAISSRPAGGTELQMSFGGWARAANAA
ncbi:MAG TPA: ATP-binding protein [Solirubrobacteraceae bacterium]|nr:ATP-binding protein [Solirubrobacteraceae bacterium]